MANSSFLFDQLLTLSTAMNTGRPVRPKTTNLLCGSNVDGVPINNANEIIDKTIIRRARNESLGAIASSLDLSTVMKSCRPVRPETANFIRASNADGGPIDSTVDIIEEIADRRARGESLGAIASSLNRQGRRGPNGARWYTASVRAYLQRSKPSGKQT